MKTAQEVAQELVEFYGDDASKWTQGSFARDAYNRVVGANSESAVCWCAVGAYSFLHKGASSNETYRALFGLKAALSTSSIANWNDQEVKSFKQFIHELRRVIAAGENS